MKHFWGGWGTIRSDDDGGVVRREDVRRHLGLGRIVNFRYKLVTFQFKLVRPDIDSHVAWNTPVIVW